MSNGQKLTSEELAVLIADSLVEAEIVAREQLELAVQVITLELEARKGVGDY